ncbi:hypothetical protein ACFSCW_15925 [Sphingomonas tabacisoli]|uniref:Uncharacterized protein n=1 Tax=Sphingomonas tabacisoli TaxID=2249466 RepID=A0ABW4I804_9SPHN
MSLAGTYECVLKTPLGVKSGSLVVVPSDDGEHFTGSLSNAMLGTMDITDGAIDGNMLLCSLQVTKPMAMKVDCEVIVDGDKLVGFVTAGAFGEMPLSGHRTA